MEWFQWATACATAEKAGDADTSEYNTSEAITFFSCITFPNILLDEGRPNKG